MRGIGLLTLMLLAMPAAAVDLTLERIFADPALAGTTPRGVKVSPDGGRVALLRGRATDGHELDLWTYDVKTGRLELAIAPWGTVFVDGEERGASPPLRVLDIAAGAHTIVIHNGGFAPHVERVVVKAGEATRIRHRFR